MIPAFSIYNFKSVLFVPSQDTMVFIFFRLFPINDFKSVLFVPSQDTMEFIFFRLFQFMSLNQHCFFHLRIVRYLYFLSVFN
jgi:hypothetical protein